MRTSPFGSPASKNPSSFVSPFSSRRSCPLVNNVGTDTAGHLCVRGGRASRSALAGGTHQLWVRVLDHMERIRDLGRGRERVVEHFAIRAGQVQRPPPDVRSPRRAPRCSATPSGPHGAALDASSNWAGRATSTIEVTTPACASGRCGDSVYPTRAHATRRPGLGAHQRRAVRGDSVHHRVPVHPAHGRTPRRCGHSPTWAVIHRPARSLHPRSRPGDLGGSCSVKVPTSPALVRGSDHRRLCHTSTAGRPNAGKSTNVTGR